MHDEARRRLGAGEGAVSSRAGDGAALMRTEGETAVSEALRGAAPAVLAVQLGDRPPDVRGKVRDVFDLGEDLLIVATDRLSAYDSVLPTGIPGRGVVLTQLSAFWFRLLAPIVPHHLLSTELGDLPRKARERPAVFAGRSMLVRKAERFDVECVVRGYLAGSGFREYRETEAICGVRLPPALHESDRLPEPLFTPATKAATGHDVNIPFETMEQIVGQEWASRMRDVSLALYRAGAAHAAARGILIADTKFEFGLVKNAHGDRDLVLIDECLTPDSSRFWPSTAYEPGRAVPSLDKQIVRDWLDASGWDHTPPAPPLPPDVVERTRAAYVAALAALAGAREATQVAGRLTENIPEGL
jgi:phosphoribosylaminoimidazole-succinocarboxamide synthase